MSDTSAGDRFFMRAALAEAKQAATEGEVPVGAVAVRDGKIIATAQEYLRQHPSGLQPRFDAAAVHLQEGAVVGQEYLENAFWG